MQCEVLMVFAVLCCYCSYRIQTFVYEALYHRNSDVAQWSISFDSSAVRFFLPVIRSAEAILGASLVQLLRLIDSDNSR